MMLTAFGQFVPFLLTELQFHGKGDSPISCKETCKKQI